MLPPNRLIQNNDLLYILLWSLSNLIFSGYEAWKAVRTSSACGLALVLLVPHRVQVMQQPVQPRGDDNRHAAHGHEAAEQGVKGRKQLDLVAGHRRDGPHAAQYHGCLEEG